MCGILGTINLPFGDGVLDLIRHRGPDDSGIEKLAVGPHHLTLGHRRLSIVDLSPAGHQPMLTPCGGYALVFNGEIYNHAELRRRTPGVAFRGHSDTETMLHLLARSGIEATRLFNGIFGFGFLDMRARKLYLARDPFGIKPCYYWAGSQNFAFASEIRPLQHLVDDSIDPVNLAELLRLRYLPSPDTPFRNIRKVRPGHILEVDLRRPRLYFREYPFIETAPSIIERGHYEALESYGELLESAVARQLMSDVEVGVLLSGGIDSALVAHFAQKHSTAKVKAFTVGFAERDESDEIVQARQTAKNIGLEHHEVRIGMQTFLDSVAQITSIVEEPLATTSVIPMFHLSALAAKHVKVVLSGQGADEAMGGYRRYRAELIRHFVPDWMVPVGNAAVRAFGIHDEAVLRGLAVVAECDDVSRFLQTYTVFGEERIRRMLGVTEEHAASRLRYFYEILQCGEQSSSALRMMSLDLRMNLADDLLLYTDKITMHHSLECRVPLLDLPLVSYAESLPRRYRLGLRGHKVLHKEFAARALPRSIVHRKKNGFRSPTGRWFKQNAIEEILLQRNSPFASYFDLGETRQVLFEHRSGFNREREIFLLLGLYYWLDECARPAKIAGCA